MLMWMLAWMLLWMLAWMLLWMLEWMPLRMLAWMARVPVRVLIGVGEQGVYGHIICLGEREG